MNYFFLCVSPKNVSKNISYFCCWPNLICISVYLTLFERQIILQNIVYALEAHFCFPYEGFPSHIRYFSFSILLCWNKLYMSFFVGLRCRLSSTSLSYQIPCIRILADILRTEIVCSKLHIRCFIITYVYSSRTFCEWKRQCIPNVNIYALQTIMMVLGFSFNVPVVTSMLSVIYFLHWDNRKSFTASF